MTKASDNQFPSVLMVNTSNASITTPSPWNAQRLFFDADGSLKRVDSADSVTAVEGGGSITFGGVSSTDTVTVASNFSVSDQGGGTARLDLFFPSSGGGIDSGTSFPGGPSTNDLYFHETHRRLFFYDGTRWVSTDRFNIPMQMTESNTNNFTTNAAVVARGNAIGTEFDLWLEDWHIMMNVLTTNDGSNYWDSDLRKVNITTGASTLLGTVDTSGDSPDDFNVHTLTIDALLANSSFQAFFVDLTKIGSAGNIRIAPGFITARVVGT